MVRNLVRFAPSAAIQSRSPGRTSQKTVLGRPDIAFIRFTGAREETGVFGLGFDNFYARSQAVENAGTAGSGAM